MLFFFFSLGDEDAAGMFFKRVRALEAKLHPAEPEIRGSPATHSRPGDPTDQERAPHPGAKETAGERQKPGQVRASSQIKPVSFAFRLCLTALSYLQHDVISFLFCFVCFFCRGQLQASEDRYLAQKQVTQALQAELLYLYSQLELSKPSDGTPAGGTEEPSSPQKHR